MKQEIKVGSVIKLSGGNLDAANALSDEIKSAQTAFKAATRWYQQAEKALWDSLYTMYPDIKTFVCRYNYDGKIVVVNREFSSIAGEEDET